MKTVVITGSNGLLGQSLVNLLQREKESYKVVGFSRGENRSGRKDFIYEDIDITNKGKLLKLLEKHQPDVIVNTAAMTNVDQCEVYKEDCDLLNISVVAYLKEYVSKKKAHLIQLSTDFIFDGLNGPYKETDTPTPISHYGRSKWEAEKLLIGSNSKYTILRTILVFGRVFDMSRSNIVLWVKDSLEKEQQINVVTDQYRMPTYVENLALACKLSMDKKSFGVFNISSNKLLSIYEIALQIAEVFGLNKELINPITTKVLNQKAKRPIKTGFDLSKTKAELGLSIQSFTEDLRNFKQKII